MARSSSDEQESSDVDNTSESEGYASVTPVKKKAAVKAKAVAKPKAAGASTTTTKPKPAAKKKQVLSSVNGSTMEDQEDISMNGESDDNVGAMAGPSKSKAKPGKKSASETYQKLSQLDHVLKRPDTYIGSVEPITQPMWVYDSEMKSMVHRAITFVPGLYKIVDEILVNAADNKIRDSTMDTLRVTFDTDANTISVYNNGKGIPIEMHATEGCYIPELIFGHLLTSSNYDDDERKVTGGRNGYGAKLANIYSTEFIVETADSASGKLYKQVFSNNMGTKGKPKITDNKKGEDWTRITFKPDLVRFNMTEIDAATVSLLKKRVYDMAGITKGVKVFLNEKRLVVKDFKAYVEMYTNGVNEISGSKGKKGANGPVDPTMVGGEVGGVVKPSIIYEKFGARWEVAFAVSEEGQFQQVSYCNSIATTKGGTHVTHIADQIVNGLTELVRKKNKAAPIKPFQIKNYLSVFINCLVENPAFDSQTKENMTLGVKKFGSKCELSEEFMKKIIKSGVVEHILSFAKAKQDQMMKKTDGHKRARITGLVKLEDANNAGTKNASKCTLILTEGDSAKALAVSGLAVVGRDNYGVFPLRGKLLNVREAVGTAVMNNAEIVAIRQIMGLQHGKVYNSVESLRYGSLMIMADQDHDGSHIKGLIINFLDFFFPSLMKLPEFLVEFITPIVKVTKAKKEISFFTIPEYEQWKEENLDGKGWKIKYFKGLGTSTATDAKKYFGAMKQHRLPFKTATQEDRELIDMAFNKKKADHRKDWLRGFVPGTYMDHNVTEVPIADFINKELILFSMADNIRSIPSVIDGFKPGQRKVLFGCFKRKLKAEIKVGQLSGYVAEHSAYHHGDVSLQGTIIGLAQDYVGSNNINVLDPNGQFGTRLQGGKDAASARYIFTNVAAITRTIFHPADDNVVNYLNDDGQSIEPSWYIPILPMVLVNGSDGIGTGWSSSIPNYNPTEIVANLKRQLAGEPLVPMEPWYRGFNGSITKSEKEKDKYKSLGVIAEIDESTFEITELPIRMWTQSYKESLELWVSGSEKVPALVKDYKEYHTDTTVHFIVSLTDKGKEAVKKEGLEKTFKINSAVNTSNMVCFDAEGKIKKYASPEQILGDFFDVRMEYYHKRKAFLVEELSIMHDRLSNQARFIQMIISKELVINNKKRAVVVADLRAREFRAFPKVVKVHVAAEVDEGEEGDADEAVVDSKGSSESDFDYLLSMALYSLTAEKVAKLLAERDAKEHELNELLKLSAENLWTIDLDVFSAQWEALLAQDTINKNKSIKAAKNKGKGKKKQEYSDESEEEYEYKPVKKVVAAKPKPKVVAPVEEVKKVVVKKVTAKAKAVPLPESDDDEMVVDVVVEKVVVKKVVAPKKRVIESDDDDEEEKVVKPVAKKVKAAPKKAIIESDDDDIYTRPKKAPVAKVVKAKVVKKQMVSISSDEEEIVKPVKKAAAPKKKQVVASDSESEVSVKAKKPAAKKAAAAPKKKKVMSDSEESLDAVSPPKPRGARVAAAKKSAYVVDLDSDEDEAGGDDAESDFEESD